MVKDFFIRFDAIVKILLIASILVVSGFLFVGFKKEAQVFVREQPIEYVDKCGEDCERKITEIVGSAIATLSAKTTVKTTETPKVQIATTTKSTSSKNQIQYIPVGGAGSTTKTDWADLYNTDFFLDTGEYGKIKEIRWSANVKIFQNGQSFARLFDVTHGTAIQGSEISTTSTSFQLIESSPLTFLGGKNVYRVQMKSLTGYEASFDSGRIKIVTE